MCTKRKIPSTMSSFGNRTIPILNVAYHIGIGCPVSNIIHLHILTRKWRMKKMVENSGTGPQKTWHLGYDKKSEN